MGRHHLDDSVGEYILKKLRYLGPQYQGKKVKPGIWWFSHPLEEIVARLGKLDKRKQGEMPWMSEDELKDLFRRYYGTTGDISGLINLAEAVIHWRRQVGLPVPSWVEDVYKSTTL